VTTLAEQARRLKAPRRGLPHLWLVTDSQRLPDPLPAARRLPSGSGIILRHYDDPGRLALARQLRRIAAQRRLVLLLAGPPPAGLAAGADGAHLAEARTRYWRRPRRGFRVTCAAHSLPALRRAERAGADAVLLSPAFPTASHPNARTLGPLRLAALCRQARLPVIALGGIDARGARRLAGARLAGLAAIAGLAIASRAHGN